MGKPFLKVTSDFTKEINSIVNSFKNDAVLVGIPEDTTSREDVNSVSEESSQINNATLLAINNFGSPLQNIPPRPVLEIGIQNAQDEIAEQFKKGAKNALTAGISAIAPVYERIGIIASNSVKKAINSQEDIEEPADSTLARRKAQGFKGTKALIVTGQMRNAITYVVKRKV